jgi:hypothetical protein
MDLIIFENNMFCQKFNINLNKIVWRFFLKIRDFFEEFLGIFQEYFKNVSEKQSQN